MAVSFSMLPTSTSLSNMLQSTIPLPAGGQYGLRIVSTLTDSHVPIGVCLHKDGEREILVLDVHSADTFEQCSTTSMMSFTVYALERNPLGFNCGDKIIVSLQLLQEDKVHLQSIGMTFDTNDCLKTKKYNAATTTIARQVLEP